MLTWVCSSNQKHTPTPVWMKRLSNRNTLQHLQSLTVLKKRKVQWIPERHLGEKFSTNTNRVHWSVSVCQSRVGCSLNKKRDSWKFDSYLRLCVSSKLDHIHAAAFPVCVRSYSALRGNGAGRSEWLHTAAADHPSAPQTSTLHWTLFVTGAWCLILLYQVKQCRIFTSILNLKQIHEWRHISYPS